MKRLIGSTVFLAMLVAQPALAQSARSVALVLDASGSMNATMPDGQTRIEAAKVAVADLVAKMDGNTRLAFRAYGHQASAQMKDCKDTALLVEFGSVTTNRSEIVSKARALTARGYTPITYSLTQAAQDIAKEESGERIVVLVSDGQETCATDPCVAARALAAADAKLTIHTIGFGVGAAARMQLQCIASVARGRYFDVNSSADLSATLGTAAAAKATATEVRVPARKATSGRILIKNTWAGYSHIVTAAEDGRTITDINGAVGQADVPAGVYNVQFANGPWRGVEVKPGETTVLEVGRLQIEGGPSDLPGYALIDPETEEVVVRQSVIGVIPLMPARISVTSGHLAWPSIEIGAGKTTILRPARITVSGANAGTYKVRTQDGREAGEVSRLFNLPLPAGTYVVDVEGGVITVELSEGQTHEIKIE